MPMAGASRGRSIQPRTRQDSASYTRIAASLEFHRPLVRPLRPPGLDLRPCRRQQEPMPLVDLDRLADRIEVRYIPVVGISLAFLCRQRGAGVLLHDL